MITDMFSLHKKIDEIDRQQRVETALKCYLGAIVSIQEHAIEIGPELTRDHRLALRDLHRTLFEDHSVDSLERSRLTLSAILGG